MSITASMNQRKAAKRIQQALRKNPYDTEALLQLAYILGTLDKPDLPRKRQILHHILNLEPAHRQASQMLFEMDRTAIGGDYSRLSAAVILTDPSANDLPEQPLILRYSIVHQILVYLFLACAGLAGLSVVRDVRVLVVVVAFLMIPLWFVSAVIEISNSGLHISRLFGMAHTEIRWNEIRECNRPVLGQGITITTHRGKSIEVSAQIQGFPFILDILQQMRPDLFLIAKESEPANPAQSGSRPTSLAAKMFE
jgi:hypothetical protein